MNQTQPRRVSRLRAAFAELLRLTPEIVGPNFPNWPVFLTNSAAADLAADDAHAAHEKLNLRLDATTVSIALDETTTPAVVESVWRTFGGALSYAEIEKEARDALPAELARTSRFLTHPVFHAHRSETELLRYMRKLADRDAADVDGVTSLLKAVFLDMELAISIYLDALEERRRREEMARLVAEQNQTAVGRPPSATSVALRVAESIPTAVAPASVLMAGVAARSKLATLVSSSGRGNDPPALLMMMSRPPSRSVATATSSSRRSRSMTSKVTDSARAPSARASSATASTCSAVRAATTTSAPASASARAQARPIPRPAPVTSAT